MSVNSILGEALAQLATLAKIPVITTASEPNGPNGPLLPEIHQFAPAATYVAARARLARGNTRTSSRRYTSPAGKR